MSWQADAVAHLRESKDKGFSWNRAKKLAAAAVRIPSTDMSAANLFEQHDTQAAFFWRIAEDAYLDRTGAPGSGNGPALAHFSGMPDDEPLTPQEIERLAHPRRGRPKAAA